MTQEHSPLPWRSDRPSSDDPARIIFGDGGIKEEVATVWYVDKGNSSANAAFIIRACNSNEELVEALKVLVNFAEREIGKSPIKIAAIEFAKVALAKAEGKSK